MFNCCAHAGKGNFIYLGSGNINVAVGFKFREVNADHVPELLNVGEPGGKQSPIHSVGRRWLVATPRYVGGRKKPLKGGIVPIVGGVFLGSGATAGRKGS